MSMLRLLGLMSVTWSMLMVKNALCWERVRLSRCLQNRSVNMFAMSYGNCMEYDGYDIESGVYPGVDFPLSVEELECLSGHDAFRSCASCFLCYYYSFHDHYIFAYKYAIRALEVSPTSSPAFNCLASLYLKRGMYVRAAFYSTLAEDYAVSSVRGKNSSVYNHMKRNHRDTLFPDYSDLVAFLVYVEGLNSNRLPPHNYFDPILKELDGSVQEETLLKAYSRCLHHLPTYMIGPSILAYEEFLAQFETLLLWYVENFRGLMGFKLQRDIGINNTERCRVFSESDTVIEKVPDISWPKDKTVVLLVQPVYGAHTLTFDENTQGMCDALALLGVPFRVVTRLISDNDYVSLQNFGVQMHEVLDKNYIYWNFEKNARVTTTSEKPGMVYDSCGNNNAVIKREYIAQSVMVWETVPFNMFVWDVNTSSKMQLVTSALPHKLVLKTRAEQTFIELLSNNARNYNFFAEMDTNRRIDILFFGNTNPHREFTRAEFQKLASVYNIRVEFFMKYDLFGSHLENVIDQAKVVLNLANQPWPRDSNVTNHTNAHSSCASAINSHRIRSLLARGKVVLSESTGSALEEAMYGGVVVFSLTSRLFEVALELLRSPERRWDLEKNARRFMVADHYRPEVPLFYFEENEYGKKFTQASPSLTRFSSLSLVAKALQRASGILWPEKTMQQDPEILKFKNYRQLLSNKVKLVEERFLNLAGEFADLLRNSSFHDPDVRRRLTSPSVDYALVWAELRCQHSSKFLDDLLYDNKLSTLMYGSVGSRNSSNLCDQRADLETFVGYIARRYLYSSNGSKIGVIGCESAVLSKVRSSFSPIFEEPYEILITDIHCVTQEDLLNSVHSSNFSLIIINQAFLKYSYATLLSTFFLALRLLSKVEGSGVLVNGMLLPFENKKQGEEWVNGDTYHLIIKMRNLRDYDASLSNYEGGLLFVYHRRNPFFVSQTILDGLNVSYEMLRKNIDKFIPILSFSEMHDWLSNSNYTNRFVRKLPSK